MRKTNILIPVADRNVITKEAKKRDITAAELYREIISEFIKWKIK